MAASLQHPKKGSARNPEVTYVQHYVLPRMALTDVSSLWRNASHSRWIADPDEVGDQADMDIQNAEQQAFEEFDDPDREDIEQGAAQIMHTEGSESCSSLAASSEDEDMDVESVPGSAGDAQDGPVVEAADAGAGGEQAGGEGTPQQGVQAAPAEAVAPPDAVAPVDPQTVGCSRTFRDPRSKAKPPKFPFCQGAGNRFSQHARQFRRLSLKHLVQTAKAAHELLPRDFPEIIGIVPDPRDNIRKVMQFVHYHRCRLSKWCLLSSRYTVINKVTDEPRSFAASFSVAIIPEVARQRVSGITEDELQPVQIRNFAIIEWHGMKYLQRVAYVKVLSHKRRELVKKSGQWIMETTGSCVKDWDDESQQCCVPVDCLQRALLIVKPPLSEMGSADATWLLIPFQGKSFGMDYSVDDENCQGDETC